MDLIERFIKVDYQQEIIVIKSVTIKDVAKKAGVSKASVWAALKTGESSIRLAPATRERIQDAVRELNYRPNKVAQSMVSQKSYLIGFSFSCNNLQYHAAHIINGLRDYCNNCGYSLVVYSAKDIEEEYRNLQQAVNRQLDGLLTIPILTDNRDNRQEYCRIAREIMPVVQVCTPLCPELPSIAHDFRYIAKHASEHLIERGHRQVVLATFYNYKDPVGGMSSFAHNEGYREAMLEAGLSPRTITYDCIKHKHPADGAYLMAEQILQMSPKPTAVVVSSNNAAFGLIRRWEELGIKVPDDISIVGCANDLDIPDCLNSGLSRFEDMFEDIGKRAFHMCLEQKRREKPEHISMKLKFIGGETVRDK